MDECPACGEGLEYNSEHCSHCQYTFTYDDVADYEPHEIVFTVEFSCQNCGRTFKHGFGKGDEVRVKGIAQRNVSVNPTGNPILAIVGENRCRPRCPTCDNDHSLAIRKRTPIRER